MDKPDLKRAVALLPWLPLLVWVERNMALPWVGTWIGWPWIFIEAGRVGALLFNLGLIAAFAFAVARATRRLAIPTVGVGSTLLMAGWQSSGVMLFQLVPSAVLGAGISFLLFWTFLALALQRNSISFALAAGLVTPMLSLDRLVFTLGILAYRELWRRKLFAGVGTERRHPTPQ